MGKKVGSKRIGANGRKRNAVRKAKLRTGFKKSVSRFFIGTLVSGVLCLCGYFGFLGYQKLKVKFEESKVMSIKNVFVQGLSHVKDDYVILKCGLKPGMKMYNIKESVIKDILSTDPWIKSVKIIKKLQGNIVIEILERKPVALVNIGKIYMVDLHGVLLPFESNSTSDLPLLCGVKDSTDSNKCHVLRKCDLLKMKKFLETVATVDKTLLARLSQADLSNPERVVFTLQSLPTIVEIDLKNMEEQLQNLVQMERIIENTVPAPSRVNLCYQNLAFVTQPLTVKGDVILSVAD